MARRACAITTFLFLTCGVLADAASALDHVVGGKQLTLRRQGSGGVLSLVLRDPAVPIPVPGGAGDPSQSALIVTLFGRGSGEQAALFAPPGLGRPGWKVRSTPRVTYAYANPAAVPGGAQLSFASLRDGAGLRIRAKSPGLLLAGPEGAVAVRIEMGAVRVCALFDGDAVRRDQGGRFLARDAVAASLANCDDDTLAARPCAESAACGGTCPGDAECAGDPFLNGCTCVSPHQPCGDTAPACNGECPAGAECSDLGGAVSPSCGCLPAGSTPCGGVYPSCGDGDCPTGTSCMLDFFTCCGGVTLENCACLSGPPPEPCPGGCPEGWSCLPPAPGQAPICIPPFCDGGSAPSCGGTCTLAGTECTTIGGLCFCLKPCTGGSGYPTCGGTCADGGAVCQAVEGQCICLG